MLKMRVYLESDTISELLKMRDLLRKQGYKGEIRIILTKKVQKEVFSTCRNDGGTEIIEIYDMKVDNFKNIK